MSMQSFVEGSKKCLVIISIAGIAFYALVMLAYSFGFNPSHELLSSGPASYMFGLPISGVVAFAVVALLDTLSPASKDASGKLEFKAFGLTFSGPAGPVTLWIAVYLTLVASMQIVK
jgi:hypothetical protein